MAVFNSMMNSTGNIDLNELEKGLLEIKGVNKDSIEKQGEDGKLPWIVTVDDWKFKIDEEGEVSVIKGISIPKSLKIVEGNSETIRATLMSGIAGKINWIIEDESIVEINSITVDSIILVAKKNGNTKIRAIVDIENETYDATCEIIVVSKVISIEVSDLEVQIGKSKQLEVKTVPNDNIEDLKYISSDSSIATVNSNGEVTGVTEGTVTITVSGKNSTEINDTCIVKVISILPEGWIETSEVDSEWYDYGGANVNKPKLIGEMTPIKYTGDLEGETNKWANAITADGSMWVWIPRYAYKITSGYHTNVAGTIEIAFIDKENNFLDTSIDGETNTTNVREAGAGTSKWLVHPVFRNDVNIGGWDDELTGIWVGKFEATGNYGTGQLNVLPGKNILVNMTAEQQYKFALGATFGENVNLNSHMAKNSEWGAIVYLAHSKYGTNAQVVENQNGLVTGGSTDITDIYIKNKKQSTTYNATGVYGMSGGAVEYVAANLKGYSTLCEEGESSESTKYRNTYPMITSNEWAFIKGDALYETSNSYNNNNGAWRNDFSCWLGTAYLYLERGGNVQGGPSGMFASGNSKGLAYSNFSFRLVLAF